MTQLMSKCCECVFWTRSLENRGGEWKETNYGKCQRFPPTSSDPNRVSDFPKTFDTSCCGEFKQRS